MKRGYFGVGLYHTKTETNVGTLWRSAFQLGASFIFTVGKRYKTQNSDTPKSWKNIPLYHYEVIEQLVMPKDVLLVGIEQGGTPLSNYSHPERVIYLLGAEDHGLPEEILSKCNHIVSLESERVNSYNVAVAGSLVMYDRMYGD